MGDKNYKGRTVFVTGCTGLVGEQLCQDLLEQGADVIGYSRTEPGSLAKNKNFKWKKGDITNSDSLKGSIGEATLVFHLAAQASVYYSILHPIEDFRINSIGTLNILEAARKNNAHCVYASTIALYKKKKESKPQKEGNTSTDTPYAISKYSGELYCKTYTNLFKIKTTILRFGYIYGINAKRGPVYDVFKAIKEKKDYIEIFVNPKTSLDLIYVKDVSSALLKSGLSENQGPFNISSGKGILVSDIIKNITRLYGVKEPKIKLSGNTRGIHEEGWCHILDISKAINGLGWKPKYSFEDAIEEIYEKETKK